MTLSVIVPVFNEQERFNKPAKLLYSYLLKTFPKSSWELIFVNDGSKDSTLKFLKEFTKNNRKSLYVTYKTNRGKGYAISQGVKKAKGTYVFFMDIDLSVKPKELPKALSAFKKNKADVIIGSRRVEGSIIRVHQPKLRETLGHCYTLLTTTLLGLPLSDLTCGFKGFKKNVAEDIFRKLTATRWSFDAETLYKAHKKGYAIYELPVTWEHVGDSKVNVGFDAVRSFIEVLKVRFQK